MSRLIVKNLPSKVSSEKLKELFAQKGEVTDVQLKYTKDGKFRNFGFVGFRTELQAAEAREYFDGSCVKSMKISVQVCAALGDGNKPRAWSKYAPDSTAYKKSHEEEIQAPVPVKKEKKKKDKKKDKVKELLEKHKEDPLFAEFIDAHTNEKTAWIKEALQTAVESNDDEEQDSGVDEGKHEQPAEEQPETEGKKTKEKIADKQISDLEYMKSLMKKKEGDAEIKDETEEEKPKKIRNRQLFHVKLTGLPYKCKKPDVKEFFRPLVPYSLRFPLGKGKKVAGFCYVGFRTEDELRKALNKDRLFLAGHRVHVQKYEDKAKQQAEEEEQNVRKKTQQNAQNEESIGESGRIFVRNLPYVATEDEITKLFEAYGPLSEVNVPVDRVLRQPKGFATVTFLMPEHAVKAYEELDGSVFSGRMLHLLPGKQKDGGDEDDEGLSFKEKKAKRLKSQAKSSHNWNTLFLGANAIADVVADTYGTTKQQLLTDHSNSTSAAVRLALGETQLVAETRKFLEENGVFLDAFSQAPKKRSKTCILVKNLPAHTTREEIRVLFEKHGQIARFIMPKHGITVLVDFVEPSEARNAFTKLAYSQFKASPLYLEWAPENTFTRHAPTEEPSEGKNEKSEPNNETVDDSGTRRKTPDDYGKGSERTGAVSGDSGEISAKEEVSEESNEEPETETTLFVKNLNFRTTDEDLKNHFSSCGKLYSATVAKKKDPKSPGQFLSMGYGFVRFYRRRHTDEALRTLQTSTLDGKTLELKRSERGNSDEVKTTKKTTKAKEQNGTKILVRNVPFQANRNEIHEIFRAFGELKTVRLPKKLTPGSDQHRGFCFVDFHSKADAKSAFDALCHSTHLYGRRMVLEWADQTDETEDVDSLRKRTAQTFNTSAPIDKKFKKSNVDVETFVDG